MRRMAAALVPRLVLLSEPHATVPACLNARPAAYHSFGAFLRPQGKQQAPARGEEQPAPPALACGSHDAARSALGAGPAHPQLLQQARSYSQCSCPGMDKLPSNKLLVEYNPEEVDRFIEVADAVEDAFPDLVVEGVEAVEGAHTFAIKMEDGTVIYAHSGSGSIPGSEELISTIRMAGAGGPGQ